MTLGLIGVACVIAAIVGGGLQIASLKFPGVSLVGRQATLAAFGAALSFFAVVKHEVIYCTEPQETNYDIPTSGALYFGVWDPTTDRIIEAHPEKTPIKPNGNIAATLDVNANGTEAKGKCSAQGSTGNNGKCRIRAVVNTTWLHLSNCK